MTDIQTATMPLEGLLGLYGNHPSRVPGMSIALGLIDEHTHYVCWSAGRDKELLQDLANSLQVFQAVMT